MDNQLDTSFIPQQPLLKVEGSLRRREPINVALVTGFIIFFVTLAVFGGMYVYKAGIDKRVLALEGQLQGKEGDLKIDDIARYKEIDARIKLAKTLLEQHTAFSTVLTLLEKITAQNIGWTSLNYGTAHTDGSLDIGLTGQAPNYSAVYAQAEALRSFGAPLKKVDVTTPTLEVESGIVAFGVTLTIDPTFIKYTNTLPQGGVLESSEVTTPSQTP